MTGQKIDILFAIMAVQEVEFFIPVARRLMQEDGLNISFLTFHEAGDDILEREGIPYFSLHKIKREKERNVRQASGDVEHIEKKLGVRVENLIFHEMHMSGRNRKDLISKATCYDSIFNDILRRNDIGCVVQELGGFIAPLTLYYASAENRTDHIFIEPAMFRKRIVFTLNNLYADIPCYEDRKASMNDDLRSLLDDYKDRKTVVIPKKDRHFFQDMTFRRLFSSDNFRRLSRKLYHKYILGREEEYNWIFQYAAMHLIKAVRRKVLGIYYTNPVEGEKYVYYPFHVPLDVQLTARCPEFFGQEYLVTLIAKSLPPGYKLYIKEHPAAIGGHSLSKLKKALALCDNIRLIQPGRNSYDIIRKAACVITVNSKVGFEAIIQGKAVIVLGKTFYRGKGMTFDAGSSLSELPETLKKAVNCGPVNQGERDSFLARAYDWSFKGELYENSPENLADFYNSLKAFMLESGTIRGKEPCLEGTLR